MRWIPINEDDLRQLNPVKTREEKGIKFGVMLSPYDLPEAVKGEYNEDRSIFEIRFRYLDEEKSKKHKIDEHISVLEGKNSGRLLGIDVDVEKSGVGIIQLAIQTLKEQSSHIKDQQKANYNAAQEVLSTKREDLLAAV